MPTHYEDAYFYYFIKPHNIPSTFGKDYCFLDMLAEYSKKDEEIKQIFDFLQSMFSRDEEYGLLNRLDNETCGLLYFAKCPLFKQQYLETQEKNLTLKHYIADVYGKLETENFTIEYPIAHHKFDETKMVAIKNGDELYRGKLHNLTTTIQNISYDTEKNTTTLLVQIHKGIRHQIRCHLASIGYPIVGEKIYIKKKSPEDLHLRSVGLKI